MRQEIAKTRAREVSWPTAVFKKWLNIRTTSFNYDDRENDSDVEDNDEDVCGCEVDEEQKEDTDGPKLRRHNSETLRAQYIKTKELKIRIGSWNLGGILPPDELNMEEWLNMEEAADIYVIGMQEIVPLNAGNVFGAEDKQRVPKWEHLIRDTLNTIQPATTKYKCYSDPPSPSRFKPMEDATLNVDELLFEGDTDTDDDAEQSHSWDDSNQHSQFDVEENKLNSNSTHDLDASIGKENQDQKQFSMKRFDRSRRFAIVDNDMDSEVTTTEEKKLLKTLTMSERIGLDWPEQPLDLIAKLNLDEPNSLRSIKSFRTYNSFKPVHNDAEKSMTGLMPKLDLSIPIQQAKKSAYVRIISKQMVGIYLSIWVRRSLRRRIQNLKVSTVGVGAMGYIGNKGSVSVSMSIYQNFFCFICSHLSAGEKNGDELKRNADAQEIHQKTQFSPEGRTGLPNTIYDHERIFWLGDLNYRIDMSYEKIHELISKKQWLQLFERDQLKREFKEGHIFDGWSEGLLNFPPTYKYEFNSKNYIPDDKKGGRRRPAWCDRILSFGNGIRLVDYRRAELHLSDHRPVSATFMVEIEEFCRRKLQKVITLADAEVQGQDSIWGL